MIVTSLPPITFQSTLSVRRATVRVQSDGDLVAISIHALREESDRQMVEMTPKRNLFQSTLSVRRATCMHGRRH